MPEGQIPAATDDVSTAPGGFTPPGRFQFREETATLLFDGIVLGSLAGGDGPLVELNLGWLRAAGVSVRLLDDPERDHHRGGVFLER